MTKQYTSVGWITETMSPEEITDWERRVLDGEWAPREVQHGTSTKYRYDRCRCDVCKAWSSAYQRAYRARKKAESAK